MEENFLEKIFEHNNWANLQIIQVCLALSDEQLDAEPQSAMKGSIRLTLQHLVAAQHSYLRTLTLPLELRREAFTVEFNELQESAQKSRQRREEEESQQKRGWLQRLGFRKSQE